MNRNTAYKVMIPVVEKMREQWCVRVPAGEGETVRQLLIRDGVLDPTLRVQREGKDLLFPITSQRAGSERREFEVHREQVELPRHELVGGIAIMHEPDRVGAVKLLASRPSLHTVVHASSEVTGEYRIREFKILAGASTTRTGVIEHGHHFTVDLSRAYFSARLSSERQRISGMVSSGELVLDMFAGVGPFAISVAARAGFVAAADLNPDAILLMTENLKQNRAENVLPVLADAHHLPAILPWKFDRVIMNLPKSGENFLADAFRLTRSGGVVHLYALVSGEGEHVARILDLGGEILAERIVRTYSPSQWHAVYDIRVSH
jgi:tRNA (guanine37-N1)-methyltransferase